MRTSGLLFTLASTFIILASPAFARYTPPAGKNAPEAVYEAETGDGGRVHIQRVQAMIQHDGHGNARGNPYDLAVDGAFEGQTGRILDPVASSTRSATPCSTLAPRCARRGSPPRSIRAASRLPRGAPRGARQVVPGVDHLDGPAPARRRAPRVHQDVPRRRSRRVHLGRGR